MQKGKAASSKLHKAAVKGNIKAAKKHIKKGLGLEGRDAEGRTPFHVAAESGKTDFILFLLEQGASINAQDNRGMTPLLRAVLARQEKMALFLIQQGANPDIKSHHDVSIWDKAQYMFSSSAVSRMRSEASLARNKSHGGNVYYYQEPSAETVKWGGQSIKLTDTPFVTAGPSSQEPAKPRNAIPTEFTEGSSPSVGEQKSSQPEQRPAVTSSVPEASVGGYSAHRPSAPPAQFLPPEQHQHEPSGQGSSQNLRQVDSAPTGDSSGILNLDEVTDAVLMFVLALSSSQFTVRELELLNGSLRPLSLALKSCSAAVPAFASQISDRSAAEAVSSAAHRLQDSLQGLAPAVRSLNEDPGSPGPLRLLLDIAKRIVRAAYGLFAAAIGPIPGPLIAQTIQECAVATKLLLKEALTRSSDLTLLQAARQFAAQTIHLMKLLNNRLLELVDVDQQHKLAECSHVIGRATEALIITAKSAFATGDAEARGNMATLAKALAEQYHKLTELTATRTAVTPMPTRFDEKQHFLDSFKQLSAAAARYSPKTPHAPPLLTREKQVIGMVNEMVGNINIMKDALQQDPVDGYRLLETAHGVSGDVSKIAAIALNTSQYCNDSTLSQQLVATLQDVLYFSMQLKLAACYRSLHIHQSTNIAGLCYSVKGIACSLALLSEAKLF